MWQAIKAATGPLRVAAGSFDAVLVAHILHALGYAAVVSGNTIYNGGWAITVLGECSSLWPLPMVAIWFFGMSFLINDRVSFRWLGVALVASIICTETRLTFCAISHADYLWWHDGPGNFIYEAVAVGSVVGLSMISGKMSMAAQA
jgi:hypothetical protein